MKKIYLIILSILITTLISSQSFACSCIPPESPEKTAERADSVFVGKVINISNFGDIGIKNKITFDVSSVIKGDKNKSIIIYSNKNGASCGYNFEENETYIVYSYLSDNELQTGLCSGTSLLKYATKDLEAFKDIIDENTIEYDNTDIKNDYKNIFLYLIIISIIIIIGMKREAKLKKEKDIKKENK